MVDRLRRRTAFIAAALTLAVGAAFAVPAFAAGEEPVPAYLTDQLAACRADLEVAQTHHEQDWAETCLALAQRAVDKWVADHPAPTPTTPAPSPTVAPTTEPPSPTPTMTTLPPSPTPTNSAPGGWIPPTAADAGVPAGWVPATVRSGVWTITQPGVYTDVRVSGSIRVTVPGVTLRRVEVITPATIQNDVPLINNETASGCNQMTLDQVTVRTVNGLAGGRVNGAIGPGGYTATRVAILDTIEGFRVGGKSVGCGPVSISDSYARVKDGGNCDLHADGLQGYDGHALTLRRTTLYFAATCGTAAYFYPSNQGNTSADVDYLYVWGPGVGFTFRMGTAGSVGHLLIGQPWVYGPIDVRCSLLTSWQASIVSVGSNGQPASVVREQACNTETG